LIHQWQGAPPSILLRQTIQEEKDDDVQITLVDKNMYPIYEGFTSNESTKPSLARMMEQEIAWVFVNEWRAG
jgi:hypothetical protein